MLEGVGRVSVEIDGAPCELLLRVPSARFELPLLPRDGAALDTNRRRERAGFLIGGMIQALDGAPLSEARRQALAAHPASIAALLELRRELHERLVHEGRALLACPTCAQSAELPLTSFMIALDAQPWPLVDAAGEPSVPSLSTLRPPAWRPPEAKRAAAVSVRFPSARLGLAGPFSAAVFGPALDAERDAGGWRRWADEEQPFDAARPHWRYASPGFRAILRMALALARLDDIDDVTPELIERLPVTDFRFADAVHHYVFGVDVHDAARASITCPACQQKFLPVL
jgi:hypothetical protein